MKGTSYRYLSMALEQSSELGKCATDESRVYEP